MALLAAFESILGVYVGGRVYLLKRTAIEPGPILRKP